jgi:pimeloyl-ACP methyl ester carboxylesterase
LSDSDPVRHGYRQVGGLRLHHLDYGGTGSPVVCLHGVMGHAWTWHHFARSLTPHAAVRCLDLRGHGDSQWSTHGAYTTADHVADLGGWLDAMHLERVALVGYSWGALIAIDYVARHPDRVERVVMLDVEASFDQSPTDVPHRPSRYASYDDVVAWERAGNGFAPDDLLELVAAGGYRPDASGDLVPKDDPFFRDCWPFRSDDHWGTLEAVTAPTLVVHAADSFVRRPVVERMASTLPAGRFAAVADCGHVVPVDNPAGAADAVVPFLVGDLA